MDIRTKNILKGYIIPYIESVTSKIGKKDKIFTCPICKNEKKSASIYPVNSGRMVCYRPSCNFNGDIFDLVRHCEGMEKWSDYDVKKYLTKLFDIKFPEDGYKELDLYFENSWYLFPVQQNASKAPIKDFAWTKDSTDNRKIWQNWIDRGWGLAVELGKKSGVIALDIDDDDTFERVKHLLPDTLIQKTRRGNHYLFKYDEDFDFLNHSNLRSKKDKNGKPYEMEVRANNAYIVIAPTSCEGEVREWNYNEILPFPKELKDFLLNLISKKNDKEKDEIIQEAIDTEKVIDLSGKRNDTFIQTAGVFSKWVDRETNYKILNFLSNNWIDKPIPKHELNASLDQVAKYRRFDKDEFADLVFERLKIIKEGTAFQIAGSLKKDIKDVEDILEYLEQQSKVVNIGNRRFKPLNNIEWTTDFSDMSVPISYEMPYFNDYAYFDNGNMTIIAIKTGGGKCFAKNTKILMHDGSYKNVQDIKTNDKVMGVDSTPRTVCGLSSGIDDMYKIIPNKGKPCIVNSKHVLSLMHTTTKKIINISLDDYLKTNKTFKHKHKLYKVAVDFKRQQLPLEPYYIGLWLGDGDSRDSRVTSNDFEIKNYIKNYAKKLKLRFVKYQYNGKCPSYKVATKRGVYNRWNFKEQLRNLDLLRNKHIPSIYKINSKENRLQLLAGLLDADGHYANGNFEIITKFEKLENDIRFLAGSLGFMVTSSIKSVKYNGRIKKYYRLKIIGDCSIIPTKLKRKKAKKRKINKNPLVTGFKVVKLKRDRYYGFTLNGDKLHLIEDFFVHHNTHLAGNLIKKLVEQDIYPDLINTEAGSKIGKIIDVLKVPSNTFACPKKKNGKEVFKHPMDIELRDNKVTIIDWLRMKDGNYAEAENTFEHFHDQLRRHSGSLIILTQLKKNGDYFADNIFDFFGAFVCKYLHTEKDGMVDNINTYFETTKIRDSKVGKQHIIIPTKYDPDTKTIELRK